MTYRPKRPPLDPCPVEHVLRLIGGRWKARLLDRIRKGPCPVGDLQRWLPRARPQVLLNQLKALEQDRLIERLAPPAGRSWGSYTLTERGTDLLAAVDRIAAWGSEDLALIAPPVTTETHGLESF